jgi:hypothetical protein
VSASAFFDLLCRYHNSARPMSPAEIRQTVGGIRAAAHRVAAAECGIGHRFKGMFDPSVPQPSRNRRTENMADRSIAGPCF